MARGRLSHCRWLPARNRRPLEPLGDIRCRPKGAWSPPLGATLPPEPTARPLRSMQVFHGSLQPIRRTFLAFFPSGAPIPRCHVDASSNPVPVAVQLFRSSVQPTAKTDSYVRLVTGTD